MNGQSRQKSQPLSNSFATVNLYLDTYYGYSFNHPKDDTIIGSGAVGRNGEWQINNATIGTAFGADQVRGVYALYRDVLNRLADVLPAGLDPTDATTMRSAATKLFADAEAKGFDPAQFNASDAQAAFYTPELDAALRRVTDAAVAAC